MAYTHSKTASSRKSGLLLAFLCTSLTIGGAIGLAIGSSTNLPAHSQTDPLVEPMRRMPAESVIQFIRQDVQKRFGVKNVRVVTFSEQNWPDGCLGLPRGKEGCTAQIVPGWRITVSDRMQSWTYRTDRTGPNVRLENPDRVGLPQEVARRLIQQVARDTKILPSQLRITAIKAHDFGGCMDLQGPNEPCTANIIRGRKAIVTSPTQSYVYHVADRIVQNKIASGAKRSIQVSFVPFGSIGSVDANVVFQSSTSGDIAGNMVRITLTSDGKLTRYQSSPTARFAPVVIKTLTPAQLNAFKQVLETQRFPHFSGLTYLTSAALADYPTTTYQDRYSSMQFVDLDKKALPRSLQQLIVRWENLIKP